MHWASLKIQFQKYEFTLKNYDFRGKIIFDGGCGTGLLLEFLINTLPQDSLNNFKIVGLDISLNMLKEFRKKLESKFYIYQKKIHIILSDLEHLPLRKKMFNLSFLFTSLQNLTNIYIGIDETSRIVKMDGESLFSILKKNHNLDQIHFYLRSKLYNIKRIENPDLEDTIFYGKALEKN